MHTYFWLWVLTTNYDIWLITGETQFTHATQDTDHGAPQSQRRTGGPTDNGTPHYSSSSYSDSRHSFHYPIPDMSMQPPTRWVYEWEDPYFYTMLVQEWETISSWTGQSWQDYKAELLRARGLNVMSTAEYQTMSQMGIFPFLRWTFIDVYQWLLYLYARLWLWYSYARLLLLYLYAWL